MPRSLDYPDVVVGAILRGAVRRWGDKPATDLARPAV
jgi:long-chain acyl-CoA synthetase